VSRFSGEGPRPAPRSGGNRLAGETSPYLRQHQDNPVDWYPWGEDAFSRAILEDKPILLSIGYSACHWCHVMAHESFEDPDTAKVMNDLFVCVKVDREERPDVDAVYMEAVLAMSGSGGWPMTVFITPDGRPFFGGTYFPPEPRHGMPAFTQLLHAVDEAWRERRDEVLGQADQLSEAILARTQTGGPSDGAITSDLLERAYASLREQHDDAWGGFGRAPKFPQTSMLELLLRAHAHNRSGDTVQIVQTSLDAMASGGIYDHLGGGFARYAVDNVWLVPHFEKMLYDQASLARVYLHAWQVTGHDRYRQVMTETIGYVLRELRQPDGGFSSAEDADSEGVEGKFYVWPYDEFVATAPDPAVAEWYGVTPGGNFEGANILHRPVRGDLLRPDEIEAARQRLFTERLMRVPPGLDDKVLTEWNAMFLSTLAEAAAATDDEEWFLAAVANADFLLRALRRDDGRWLRSWQGGRAKHLAFAADHAWLIDAFTRLGEATGEARWISAARDVADRMLDLFWDSEGGGLFTVGSDAEQLIVRAKDLIDGATPSANSVAALALLRLSALTGDERYADRAEAIIRLVREPMSQQPTAFTALLAAVDVLVSGVTEIAVVGDADQTGNVNDLVEAVQCRYLPTAVLAWGEPYDSPLWESRLPGHAYVCRNYTCQQPVTDPDALVAQLP
jgi:uncharacterized protein YyaL (SSP411 family)